MKFLYNLLRLIENISQVETTRFDVNIHPTKVPVETEPYVHYSNYIVELLVEGLFD